MSGADDKAWTEFVRLRGELKVPGFCCGTMRTEREAFDIATALPAAVTCHDEVGFPHLAAALQELRAELDLDMQQMYPEILTAVAPPTRADILDVMVKLQAITPAVGPVVPEFAMEVISNLVAMIDVERLA